MEAELEAYHRQYKDEIISLLAFSGLWPEDSRQPKYIRLILLSFTAIVEVAFICAACNFAVVNSHKMNAIVASIGILSSWGSLLSKLVVMWIYERDILYLNRGLTSTYEKDLQLAEYRPHLLAHYRAFYRFFKGHYYYFSAILLFGMSVPIIAACHGGAARLYPIHPPFRYEPGGARHWMIFAFEVVSGAYAVTATVGCDSLFGLYALNLVGEMRLLTHRFRNLKSGKYYRIELKECVDRHAFLMEAKNVMQRLFGLMSVLLAVTTAVIVCANIFTLTLNKTIPTYKAAFLIDYTVAKLFQAYMFSWFGNCINVESKACLNAIYDNQWAGSGDLRLMNDILIVQSQSPMYFETMGIMKVGLDMFSKILNTSISYYFLLKTVADKLSNTAN